MKSELLELFKGVLFATILIILQSCGSNSSDKIITCKLETLSIEENTIGNINLFLETSGSMRGFMPTNQLVVTSFQKRMDEIAVSVEGSPFVEKINYYRLGETINDLSYSQLESILRNGLPARLTATTSDIPSHLSSIISTYSHDNSLSLLVSEFIYAPPNNRNVEFTRSEFRKVLAEAKQKNLAVSIFAFSSEFKGSFYSAKRNSKVERPIRKCCESMIPYYVWAIGQTDDINTFAEDILDEKYEHQINFNFNYSNPDYAILPSSLREGGWFCGAQPNDCRCKEIYDVGYTQEWEGVSPEFTIAVNLEHLPSYMKERSFILENIKVKTSNSSIVRIKDVLSVKDTNLKNLKPIDESLINSATHLLLFTIEKLNDSTEIEIYLENSLPKWVYDWSTNDDSQIDSVGTKTFALLPMMQGVKESFDDKKANYIFRINVSLKTEEDV